MAQQVLVLNATYEPINVCSLQRAVVLVLKNKAEILERAVAPEEVIPRLCSTTESTPGGVWICAPITEASKVYPLPLWRDVFVELRTELAGKNLLLVGSND